MKPFRENDKYTKAASIYKETIEPEAFKSDCAKMLSASFNFLENK